MSSALILVRHSLPELDPHTPASQWRLGDEGRRRCDLLAARLAGRTPAVIASSPEPKALETAMLVVKPLAWRSPSIQILDDLCEHKRDNVPWLSQEEFDARLIEFFARPDQRVLGDETAAEAQRRFTRAIAPSIARQADGDTLVFSHATVITLFVTACTKEKPFEFWRKLGMPAFAVLTLPDLDLLHVESHAGVTQG